MAVWDRVVAFPAGRKGPERAPAVSTLHCPGVGARVSLGVTSASWETEAPGLRTRRRHRLVTSSRCLHTAWRFLRADPEDGGNDPPTCGPASLAARVLSKGPIGHKRPRTARPVPFRLLSPSYHRSVTERCPAERRRPRRDCPLRGLPGPRGCDEGRGPAPVGTPSPARAGTEVGDRAPAG